MVIRHTFLKAFIRKTTNRHYANQPCGREYIKVLQYETTRIRTVAIFVLNSSADYFICKMMHMYCKRRV